MFYFFFKKLTGGEVAKIMYIPVSKCKNNKISLKLKKYIYQEGWRPG
jgi:hypothetical protein